MNIENIRNYCLSKHKSIESTPFDEVTLVYKVGNKMFALLSIDGDNLINLKCETEKAIELREHYSFIIPGYHMSKTHWNSVYFKECPDDLLIKLVDESYDLIMASLPKKLRLELELD